MSATDQSAPAVPDAWREVSKDEFFREMGPLNVHPSLQGRWPYRSEFKIPSGQVRGQVVGYLPEGSALEAKQYLLPK